MRYIRRLLQVVALVGTLIVGIIALTLIVSQTSWFRDWLRRFIVRESEQYVNGQLAIGGLGGNLLFGVNLSDVTIDMAGQRVLSIKGLEADYSVFDIISKGVVIDDIKLIAPVVRVERDATGWNLGRLIKEQRKEADREGPAAPLSLPSIELTDGRVTIDDKVGSTAYRLPSQIDGLHIKGSFEYAPVHYSVKLDDVSFRGSSPDLTLQQLAGGIALRDDNLYVQKLTIRTGASTIALDGVIEDYLRTPVMKITTSGRATLTELAAVVPAAEGYALSPEFEVTANGAASGLALELNVRSEAGNVRGQIVADLQSPDLGGKGQVDLEKLNLAPLLKDPEQRSDFTGHATVDLTMASAPETAPALERLKGTFAFNGPRVLAAGYQAANVRVKGGIAGPRITLDASAAAYGTTSTAAGFIVVPAANRPLSFDLRGSASGVDLRKLPAVASAPKLATNLAVSEYHVTGAAGRINGSAVLRRSVVEGATIADGTVAEFATAKGSVSYSARGAASELNLQRIGRALNIPALDKPEYDTRLNSSFDVRGSGTALEKMTLDATGTLTDSDAWGAHLPQLGYEAHVANGGLTVRADGRFEHLNPGRVAAKPSLDGTLTGTANVTAQIASLTAPITPDAITADGVVTLETSRIGDLQIDTAAVEGRYASQVGELRRLTLAGPAVKLEASGRVALDKAGSSDLKYHVDAIDLASLGALAGQQGIQGAAVLDGSLTGNAASLQTTGTLSGTRLAYQENGALDLHSEYTVTVPDLQFANARVKAATDATFVKVAGLEINELKATTTYADRQLAFDTSLKQPDRELDASGDVVLHPDHQEIHLPRLTVRTQGVEWRTVAGSAATIKYGNDRVQLDGVRLESGDQTLDVSGALALQGTVPDGTLTVSARNVDIAQIEKLAMQNRGLTGRVNATAKIDGTAKAPIVSGHVVVSDGGFQAYKYQSLTADVDYQGTRVGIDATLQQSPAEALTVKGSLPTTLFKPSPGDHVAPSPGDELDLHVTTTAINLGMIQGFTTFLTNVTGLLRVDLRVSGSGADPHVEGIVDIAGGGFGVPLTGVSYTGLNTSIALSPDQILIPNLRIVDEEGETLTITGSLGVHARKVGAVDVTIASRNFELVDNELGDVGVETSIKVTGELRRPKVVGDVKLLSARLEVDKILALFYDPYSVAALPDVVSAERPVDSSASAEDATRQSLARAETSVTPSPVAAEAPDNAPPAPAGAFAPVELKVHLSIPENLVLRGKSLRPGGPTGAALGDLNITVGGDLDINKEPGGQMMLLGSVETIRGTYQFQGRRFDLVRGGTVRFIGETEINPLLDITATRTIPNTGVEARVHVTGTAKAPELQLTSNPPLDESDILALIVFNRPVNELGSGERASLAATAGGIATGFLAAPLGDSIGRALDLDLFEISTTTEEGDLGAGLTLGQQIGDRAFFRLRQQFGERSTSEFMIEYQLADFLRMQASAAPETTGSANRIGQRRIERAGVSLIFFFSY